ncbi:hypothetical protein PB2503_11429 [Parvularcula bermudensis HTCC2503]|uniref:Helix-turn-helix domain-containing protein n=1 Tax=Parvularcula bermudensis (strain ATCC BAA-594 / HTCC2503 / KCTC 12087) TaxID=314260 RepID=E0TCH5_PARBH|nr:helix-turn-helix domain-containing protein [Parvularcula bermudensis]ADM10331.1 hypothetical protein PB2503_11429 [Parvularcula bermudensis HTCC2503]
MAPNRELLTTREAATYFGCSRQKLEWHRHHRNGGPRYSKIGALVRYSLNDLHAYLEETKVEALR